jgi:hypothetical protein
MTGARTYAGAAGQHIPRMGGKQVPSVEIDEPVARPLRRPKNVHNDASTRANSIATRPNSF